MVRKAKEADYESILKLRDSYLLDHDQLNNPEYLERVQNEGFVIRKYSRTDFLDDLQKEFLVYEYEGEIIAYLRTENSIDSDFLYERLNVWMNNAYKDIYFNEENHIEVGALVVAKDYQEKGILKKLLHEVIEVLRGKGYKHLFSNVVYAPLTNMPSMLFHEECGFEKVCLTTSANMNDMQNYQGLLYVKEL